MWAGGMLSAPGLPAQTVYPDPADRAVREDAWTLLECMQYALVHSPENRIQEAVNDSRRIDRREAGLNFLPSVTANASANTSFGRLVDPETNIYTNTTAFGNSYDLSASLNLFNGFSAVNGYRIARTAERMGVAEAQQVRDDICLKTIQAYYDVVYRQGLVELAREQLEETRQTLHQSRTMAGLGLKSEADLLELESQLAERDFQLTRQENLLAEGLLTLKQVMSYPMDRTLAVDGSSPAAQELPLIDEPADSIFQAARQRLPSLRISDCKIRTARLHLQTARWKLVPYVYAQAGISTGYAYNQASAQNAPFWNQLRDKQGQYVGVGIRIPIFTALSQHNDIARRKNDLKQEEARKDKELQAVESEIRRAVQDMQGAAKEFLAADKQVKAKELAHQANRRKYTEGLVSEIELQTSSNQLLEAKAQRLNCSLQYLLKRRVVLYYQGTGYMDQF